MVIFEKISAFPNNQYELAVYTFEFVLPNELPAGGLIFITFPDGFYSSLPSPPFDSQCSISGGLRSY
jgi:hypothetical protein